MRALLFAIAVGVSSGMPPACVPGVTMPQGDLPGMPLAANGSASCAALCEADAACALYTWHAPSCVYPGNNVSCALTDGCCWLKSEEVSGAAPAVDDCACSGYVRAPASNFTPARAPPAGARNALYFLIDDLRPELEPYG